MKGLIVFVKNPELGKVKTRLAKTLGEEKALEIYLKLLAYTRKTILELEQTNIFVFYSSFIDKEDDWDETIFNKKIQIQGDLGHKMSAAFESTFQTCQKVLIIGSDCPQLTSQHINSAFENLETHNVVLGPSLDGGYYLLGMDKFYPELFEGINWSTESVANETINQAKDSNLKVSFLENLSDIDYEEDWNKYGF